MGESVSVFSGDLRAGAGAWPAGDRCGVPASVLGVQQPLNRTLQYLGIDRSVDTRTRFLPGMLPHVGGPDMRHPGQASPTVTRLARQ